MAKFRQALYRDRWQGSFVQRIRKRTLRLDLGGSSLLIATILSAQCTDNRVNIVTKEFFQRYRTAEDLPPRSVPQIEKAIKSTGFFRNKAKNIKGCCQGLVERHAGQVPRSLESLVVLPGVGRKTANVVLGTAFGIASGVVVDTHVGRFRNRLGLSESKDPVKIEQDLMRELPSKEWIVFSHRMIQHGRRVCMARIRSARRATWPTSVRESASPIG